MKEKLEQLKSANTKEKLEILLDIASNHWEDVHDEERKVLNSFKSELKALKIGNKYILPGRDGIPLDITDSDLNKLIVEEAMKHINQS